MCEYFGWSVNLSNIWRHNKIDVAEVVTSVASKAKWNQRIKKYSKCHN